MCPNLLCQLNCIRNGAINGRELFCWKFYINTQFHTHTHLDGYIQFSLVPFSVNDNWCAQIKLLSMDLTAHFRCKCLSLEICNFFIWTKFICTHQIVYWLRFVAKTEICVVCVRFAHRCHVYGKQRKINAMQLGWCLFQSHRKFSCQMNAITCR